MNDIKTADSPYVLGIAARTMIVSLRLLRLLRLGHMVTISQRPSEEEAEVGSRNEGMEEKGGPGTGLRSYI